MITIIIINTTNNHNNKKKKNDNNVHVDVGVAGGCKPVLGARQVTDLEQASL